MKFESSLDFFKLFIILVKIIFIVSAIGHIILSNSTNANAKKYDPELVYWKEHTEFIFIISMSTLLIYHFNPFFSKKQVYDEIAILFFLFGVILIFTANWTTFYNDLLRKIN